MARLDNGVVQVSILAPKPCRANPNVTIKQIYSSLLRSKEQVTTDLKAYEEALSNTPDSQTSKDNNKVPKIKKYYVKDCALVGNALIAKPSTRNFKYFPARLKKEEAELGYEVTDSPSVSYEKNISGNKVVSPRTGNTLGEGRSNAWIPGLDVGGTTLRASPFYEGSDGLGYKNKNTAEVSDSMIKSDFDLDINQPFAFDFIIHNDFSPEQRAQLTKNTQSNTGTGGTASKNSSSSSESTTSSDVANKSFENLVPWVEIAWGSGNYVLQVFSDSRITFKIKDENGGEKVIADRVSFSFANKSSKRLFDGKVVIYPLGNSVFVYGDAPTIELTAKKQFLEFNLKEPVKIPAGPINMTFCCNVAFMNYSPVLHLNNGLVQSPVISVLGGSTDVIVNSFHLGKYGVGSRGENPVLPDPGDKEQFYSYWKDKLGDSPIQIRQVSVGSGGTGFAYQLHLNVKKDYDTNAAAAAASDDAEVDSNDKEQLLKDVQDNIYSAAVFSVHFTFVQPEVTPPGDSVDIDSDDILNVTVNQSVERQTATIVLDNRNFDGKKGGKYTKEGGFCGIKDIQIKMGFGNQSLQTVFTGFTSKWTFRRSGATQSTVTIECEDVSKKAKEQFAVNLPFFDGWCHLGAMKYLLVEAGFAESQIDMPDVSGSIDSFEGGCFDGHSDAPPTNDYIHATLPLAVLGVSEPAYNFAFGTYLWTCMQRIREFINWYLYADHLGNIVYQPPKNVISGSVRTFKEVDEVGDFNEIHSTIESISDTSEMRNGVYLQGNTFVANKEHPELSNWTTHVHIKNAFPSDQKVSDPFYAPYRRVAFIRNPKYEDVNLARAGAIEIFRRLTRDRTSISFQAWGQLDIHPYDVITINESIMDETGTDGKQYVVAAHTLTADGQNHTILSNFNCEVLDEGSVNYDPSLPPAHRE